MSINKKKETVKSRSLLQQTWHRLLKNKGAVIGMIFLIALVAVSFAAGYIYDYDNDIIAINVNNALQKPSMQHWFGTDNLGRDIFARILYGARYSLMIGVGAVSIGLVIGITLGAVAGFYGGMIDQIIMRIVDVFYSIPNIMIAVVIVSLLGTSTVNLLIALCFTCATSFRAGSRHDDPRSAVCRSRIRTRSSDVENHYQTYFAELSFADNRSGNFAHRHDDHRRVFAFVSRNRSALSRSRMGCDAFRRTQIRAGCRLYVRNAGHRDNAYRFGLESFGRRLARCA